MAEPIVELGVVSSPPNPADSLGNDDLNRQLASFGFDVPELGGQPAVAATQPTPTQAPTGVTSPQIPVAQPMRVEQQPPVAIPPAQPSVEQVPVVGQTPVVLPPEDKKFMDTKGFQSQADIEKAITALGQEPGVYRTPIDAISDYRKREREWHQSRQLESEKKRQESQAPVIPAAPLQVPQVQPQYPTQPDFTQYNEQFKEDFERDPLGTMAKAAFYMQEPLRKQLEITQAERELEIKRADRDHMVERLMTSPETTDFNRPDVQVAIKKVMDERPELMFTAQGILDGYKLAAYEVYRNNQSRMRLEAEKAVADRERMKKAAGVEVTSQTSNQIQPNNPYATDINSLEEEIRRRLSRGE